VSNCTPTISGTSGSSPGIHGRRLLRVLLVSVLLVGGCASLPKDVERMPTFAVDDAFTQGLYFIEEDNGKNVRLARYRMVVGLTLSAPDDPEVIAALNDLGVTAGRSTYVLRPPMHAVPGVADPYAIWVSTRSMIDVINLATQWVDVPAAHTGIVPQLTALASDSSRMPSLRIRSSKEVPPFPYRVQHRGYWFYVDDTEIESKVFLEVMVAAYSSRVGSKEAQDAQPQLVLPVGGG